MRSRLATGFLLLGAVGCAAPAVRLHAPELAPTPARAHPAKLDLEPIAMRDGATAGISSGVTIETRPDVASVITTAMRAELESRALEGGEPGGYTVKCALDRFALRIDAAVAGSKALATLYADLACEVERAGDRQLAWRGELRGRAFAQGGSTFTRDTQIVEKLADRMMSDATRERASDLAIRVLRLEATPSARSFADDDARAERGGIDDAPLGLTALAERIDDATKKALADPEASVRAAAWNAVAMSVGPGDPWPLGGEFVPDDDTEARFYQYKALARAGTAVALSQLRDALGKEDQPLLAELARDAIASGGIGVARTKPSTATNGATTNP